MVNLLRGGVSLNPRCVDKPWGGGLSLAMLRSRRRGPALRKKTAPSPLQRSRGTGPRATVKKRFPATIAAERPRAPKKTAPSRNPTIAGDRPPRYGEKTVSCNARGGNPLGCACGIRGPPRYDKKTLPFANPQSRGTGPRATGNNKEPLDIYIHIWYPIDIWKTQSQRIPQH